MAKFRGRRWDKINYFEPIDYLCLFLVLLVFFVCVFFMYTFYENSSIMNICMEDIIIKGNNHG